MYGKTEAGVGKPVLVDSSGRLDNAAGGNIEMRLWTAECFQSLTRQQS